MRFVWFKVLLYFPNCVWVHTVIEIAYEYCRKMEASNCPILMKIEYNDKFF